MYQIYLDELYKFDDSSKLDCLIWFIETFDIDVNKFSSIILSNDFLQICSNDLTQLICFYWYLRGRKYIKL